MTDMDDDLAPELPGETVEPVEDQWYRHLDKGQEFMVVAVNADDGTVEIQHFDGDVEELDLEDWYGLPLEAIEPPENWTGPFDDIEPDDLDYDDTAMSEGEWQEPLQEIPTEAESPTSEEPLNDRG